MSSWFAEGMIADMAENVSSGGENSTQQQYTASEPKICTQHNEIAKPKINGGLQAWLAVIALFCVFVNSWSVFPRLNLSVLC